MSKDCYYFSHDSNAKDDPKCMLLIDQLGLEGYGIYWVLIEVLREQNTYKYPLNLVPILARRYNTSAEKMKTVIDNYNFFEFDDNDNFYSPSLLKRMERMNELKEKKRQAGIKSGQARQKNKSLRQSNTCSTDVKHVLNKNEQSKVNESKVNESKVNESKVKKIKVNKNKSLPINQNKDLLSEFSENIFICYNEIIKYYDESYISNLTNNEIIKGLSMIKELNQEHEYDFNEIIETIEAISIEENKYLETFDRLVSRTKKDDTLVFDFLNRRLVEK